MVSTGKSECGSGSQPVPQGHTFLTAHGPEDPPELYPCFQAITAGLSTPSRAHLVSSCFGKCPHLPPYCVGLLAQRRILCAPPTLCAPFTLAGCSEWACPAWLIWSFDNLCRMKVVVSEQQCSAASVIDYLQMLVFLIHFFLNVLL